MINVSKWFKEEDNRNDTANLIIAPITVISVYFMLDSLDYSFRWNILLAIFLLIGMALLFTGAGKLLRRMLGDRNKEVSSGYLFLIYFVFVLLLVFLD
ncbi:hypothetical protein [Halobacillus sp. A5]|uniref:hypothetical protein n=1 Tax=Halobacillus sp. A5 TaxID=2880263 RepID=UPI0020A6C653|nr:hypothetical protein [Halobacillus sp. A5]MCP3027176.1 hypothetical protein [Halobacillus sp. A5]